MYAFIEGTIEEKNKDSVIINANGVGYYLTISSNTYQKLPPVGEKERVYTYLNVREDAMTLFGFSDKEEKEMFERLISVSGVGPKVAVAALSYLSAAELILAIVAEDTRAFAKVPGVGKKTAQRIILELKEKVGKEEISAATLGGMEEAPGNIEREAIAGLVALGYGQSEAALAVSNVSGQTNQVDKLIMLALKQFGR